MDSRLTVRGERPGSLVMGEWMVTRASRGKGAREGESSARRMVSLVTMLQGRKRMSSGAARK